MWSLTRGPQALTVTWGNIVPDGPVTESYYVYILSFILESYPKSDTSLTVSQGFNYFDVCKHLFKATRFLRLYTCTFSLYIVWPYWPQQTSWPPDLGPMNFTVMVEGFIMDVITIIMHSLIEKDILTFNTFSLYDPIGPAPKSWTHHPVAIHFTI